MFLSFAKNTTSRLAWLGLPLCFCTTLTEAAPQGVGPHLGLFLETAEGAQLPDNAGFQFAAIAISSGELASGFYYVPDGLVSCANLDGFIAADPDARDPNDWGNWDWVRDPFDNSSSGVQPDHLTSLFPQDWPHYNYSVLTDIGDPSDFLLNMEKAGFMEVNPTDAQQWFQPILTPEVPGPRASYWNCFYPRWHPTGPSASYWRRIHAGGVPGARRDRSLVSSTAWARTLLYQQALAAGITLGPDFFEQHYADLIGAGLQVDVQGHAIRGRDFEGQAALLFPDRDDHTAPLVGLKGQPPHRKSNTPKKRFPILGDLPPGNSLQELNDLYGVQAGQEPLVPRGEIFVFRYPYFGGNSSKAQLEYSDGSTTWVDIRLSGYSAGTPFGFTHGDLCELTVPLQAVTGPCRISSLVTMSGSSQASFNGVTAATYSLIVQ